MGGFSWEPALQTTAQAMMSRSAGAKVRTITQVIKGKVCQRMWAPDGSWAVVDDPSEQTAEQAGFQVLPPPSSGHGKWQELRKAGRPRAEASGGGASSSDQPRSHPE